MTLNINLPQAIEQQLIQDATAKGMSLDNYLGQMLKQKVYKARQKKAIKTASETDLLKKINLTISETEWDEYRNLNVLRRAETLTTLEYERLIELGEKIEIANVERVKNLITLANLRNVSLEKLMTDLGIRPVEV
jgi:hypothetical protein